ncbi:MAG TPA: transcriptional repressor [Petrotogaceae bacterium]|nr:transcriptional repressor [Petrotogaceae bacterium]HPX16215.1 transcriptional repressor [Petrotogaceae bacterium]HQC40657.1 transcriptional repressor [Petrotogaceae bacterium]
MTQQDLLKSALKTRKQRMTAKRELILRVFMDSNGKLLSIDDVFMEMRKKRSHRTSKMTVKRAIDLLVDLGLLKEVLFDDDNIKYEYVKTQTNSGNAIFVCTKCGKAFNVDLDQKMLKELFKNQSFHVKEVSLKISGICEECAEILSK